MTKFTKFSACTMCIAPTGDEGINTMRLRFKVTCETCKTVVHGNTTGPLERIKSHLLGMLPGLPDTEEKDAREAKEAAAKEKLRRDSIRCTCAVSLWSATHLPRCPRGEFQRFYPSWDDVPDDVLTDEMYKDRHGKLPPRCTKDNTRIYDAKGGECGVCNLQESLKDVAYRKCSAPSFPGICGSPQFKTTSGFVCVDGHGEAPYELATMGRLQLKRLEREFWDNARSNMIFGGEG